MTADELLDAHVLRLRNDPGYAAIWQRANSRLYPEMKLIVAMLAWAEQADGLRAMARYATGGLFAVECPSCKAKIGLMIKTEGGQ